MLTEEELRIASLGDCLLDSPLHFESASCRDADHFVPDDARIRARIELPATQEDDVSYQKAGPREKIFFAPSQLTVAIVTCGGLSPGLNNVIRSAFSELTYNYGVKTVLGIRNGFLGMNPASGREPIHLNQELVRSIDKLGGSALGTSRGPQELDVMCDFLVSHGVGLLLCLGGDGTMRGTQALHEEITRRNLSIAVVGIPKTIDNDIPFVEMSFGYVTALEKASEVIRGAHVEARSAVNGIGLVKLMGRHAGFIAAGASVVSQEVNFTLIPEIEFPLEGEHGLLSALEQRIRDSGHAVIVVAEGAGQHLLAAVDERRDASGNLLHGDIGAFLRAEIVRHFHGQDLPVTLKYLDPSYHIRSVPADVFDRYLCDHMARHAVHAGMAGKTGMIVGYEHHEFIHVPIAAVTKRSKRLDVTGDLWRSVLQVTGQPRW